MGDVTSGGVQDDAAANADISGGGGGGSSSNYSYSDLGQSPGAMGGVQVGGETRLNEISPTSVPTVTAPSTPFSLGFGGAQGDIIAQDYMNNLNTLTGGGGGGGSSADSSAVSVSESDTTMAALRRGAPALMASNAAEEAVQTAVAQPKFMFDYGFGTAGSPQIDTRDERADASIVGPIRTLDRSNFQNIIFPAGVDRFAPMGQGMGTYTPLADQPDYIQNIPSRPSGALTQAALPATRPSDAVMLAAAAKNPTSERDFSFREFLGNIFKNLGSKAKSVGAFISGLSAEKLQDYAEQFLAGGANQKASTVGMDPFAQQGMGPGPFVGGGAPSPSGDGGGGMAMPAKDPCPPGFRFDPTLQQCVPIIAPNTPTDTTTPPPAPTPPAPTPPAAGGIADAYPFVLTPPIGTPVGNLPPVRLTT
jgi:hypothetical protein